MSTWPTSPSVSNGYRAYIYRAWEHNYLSEYSAWCGTAIFSRGESRRNNLEIKKGEIEVSSWLSFWFLKQPVCHAGVPLHNSSHSVSHIRFFMLNCYGEVTWTTNVSVNPAEFIINAFNCVPYLLSLHIVLVRPATNCLKNSSKVLNASDVK